MNRRRTAVERITGRPQTLPHHGEPERVVDEWEDSNGFRYRLAERGGLFRLYTWNLYRWEISEAGLQAVARRIAELHREENVVPMIRRTR